MNVIPSTKVVNGWANAPHNNKQNRITAREQEVLDHISYGLTTKEIANRLYVSDHTIISHRKKLLLKMDARNTAGLVRKGFEYGLLSINNLSHGPFYQIAK